MKKVLSFLSIAAMVCMVACNGKDNPKKPGGNDGGDDTEYVAPIKADGDPADWAKLDASKVQSCSLVAADTWAYPEIKSAKVYADELYVYIWMEFNKDVLGISEAESHFGLYINGDNNTATGGYAGQWEQGETPCIDVLVMGTYHDGTDYVAALNCEVYNWTGDANADGWSWGDVEVSGFAEGACTSKGLEFALARDLYPAGTFADEFTMGFQLQTSGWDATGALPNAEPSDANPSGKAPLLKVVVNK